MGWPWLLIVVPSNQSDSHPCQIPGQGGRGGNPPIQVRSQDWGGGTPYWNSIACTCYAAGGMPLASTQEYFLVWCVLVVCTYMLCRTLQLVSLRILISTSTIENTLHFLWDYRHHLILDVYLFNKIKYILLASDIMRFNTQIYYMIDVYVIEYDKCSPSVQRVDNFFSFTFTAAHLTCGHFYRDCSWHEA